MRSGSQIWCDKCWPSRRKEIANKWARENPPSKDYTLKKAAKLRERAIVVGDQISALSAEKISKPMGESVPLLRLLKIVVPFTYAASKNAGKNFGKSRVWTPPEMKRFREGLIAEVSQAQKLMPMPFYQNKVWLDIYIQKPNHRGDAVNLVDGICDGIKDAIGVDDRWFSIRRLDWQIVKTNPQIFIGIGQEHDYDAQSCHTCGRILPFTEFNKSRSLRNGVSRKCKSCCSGRIPEELI